MGIFDKDWDIVVNLGIKCNTLSLSVKGGVRYFSSPFDNIDTVEGLRECGDLLASKFNGYFDDVENWKVKNHLNRETNEVHTKILWHKDTPSVYYPHFNERWLSGRGISGEELQIWKSDPKLDVHTIFPDLSQVFSVRQKRLVKLLESGLRILFLRVDERRNVENRITPTNTQEDFEYFIDKVSKAFPDTEVSCLYLYCQDQDSPRNFENSEYIEYLEIPIAENRETEDQFVIDTLKKLQVIDRDVLLGNGFGDSE